jgi:hypothetical protein
MRKTALGVLALVLLLAALPSLDRLASAATGPMAGGKQIFLPIVIHTGVARRVNAPYFAGSIPFSETAIFWFGRITPSENYADVRVGYNASELYVYLAAFDRRIWYDTSPSVADLTKWDAATLAIDMAGNSAGRPGASAYRFVAQFNDGEERAGYQAAYRGNGSGWQPSAIAFTTSSGWRGDATNNTTDDRGWAATFRVPFASLGLAAPPAQGTIWGLTLSMHDRDDAAGTPIADKAWPAEAELSRPVSWGQLRFGTPGYVAPPAGARQTITIRDKLNGAHVVDGDVGGGNDCGEGLDYWTEWPNTNYANAERNTNLNIQNQSDLADWPCFSKAYITFPLNGLPPGKVVISARLTLYQFGGSDPSQAKPSLIQVSTVTEDWGATTLTWNSAPLAGENVAAAWVGLVADCDWPCVPRVWDVSRAVSQAYQAGTPLRLALYSADNAYHSGKFFTTSETGDWNEVGRPTLTITLGDAAAVQ